MLGFFIFVKQQRLSLYINSYHISYDVWLLLHCNLLVDLIVFGVKLNPRYFCGEVRMNHY